MKRILFGAVVGGVEADFLDTILEAANKDSRSEREISRMATGQSSALSMIKTGRVPSVKRTRALCEALGLEFYVGPPRDQVGKSVQRVSGQLASAKEELESTLRKAAEVLDRLQAQAKATADALVDNEALAAPGISSEIRQFPGAEPVAVRRLGTTAGSGTTDLDESVKGYAYFPRGWLSRRGLAAERCSLMGVMGNSMEPTLPEGCAILLDHSRQRRREGHVFVVRRRGGLVVRRAGKDGAGNWLLLSDHSAWTPEPWSDAEVIGEVKWVAKDL